MGAARRAGACVPHPRRSKPVPMERGSRATAGGARARRLNAATGSDVRGRLVRGLPALAFRRELGRRELLALALLQATSLPFLIAATAIGREMGLLDPAISAGLVAAGLVSVLVFPAVALAVLPRVAVPVSP